MVSPILFVRVLCAITYVRMRNRKCVLPPGNSSTFILSNRIVSVPRSLNTRKPLPRRTGMISTCNSSASPSFRHYRANDINLPFPCSHFRLLYGTLDTVRYEGEGQLTCLIWHLCRSTVRENEDR